MSYILTLVAAHSSKPLSQEQMNLATDLLMTADIRQTCEPVWLSHDKAADLGISDKPEKELQATLKTKLYDYQTDFFITPIENRRKKLLMADMDSTIVSGETLDELADFAGIKEKIAQITEQAMEGKLDFTSALQERVNLIKGLTKQDLQKTLERIQINPGAKQLVQTMKKHGATCVLVSGGFSFFTHQVAANVGFDHDHGNMLELNEGIVTGRVEPPILDKHSKFEILRKYMRSLKIGAEDCFGIGDGANDIPMLEACGLGIGFKPKPVVEKKIDNAIIHGDLSAALFAQGYSESDFAENSNIAKVAV